MRNKIPFKHSFKPVQAYDLDNKDHRIALGIQKFWNDDPAKPPKRADRYVRYANGKFGVVELKPSLLKKAPEQLKSSADMLLNVQKAVDYLIVVLEDLGSFERENFYRVIDDTLCRSSDGKPTPIPVGSRHLFIEVFREPLVNTMWVADNKLFGGS
jgi:hypothetical protein